MSKADIKPLRAKEGPDHVLRCWVPEGTALLIWEAPDKIPSFVTLGESCLVEVPTKLLVSISE